MNDLISLQDAAKMVPGQAKGRIHIMTLYRWATTGVQGHRLQTTRIGGRIFTKEAWIQKFMIDCSNKRKQK